MIIYNANSRYPDSIALGIVLAGIGKFVNKQYDGTNAKNNTL
jgi:hypothetical protein